MLVKAETLTVGLSVRLEAKPGRETDLEALLRGAAPLAEAEPATLVWLAVRLGPTTFGIFDAFPDEAGREAHLAGRIAAALGEHAAALLAAPPAIARIDVLAAKLP
jgi:quinol monooxygenase YgiN